MESLRRNLQRTNKDQYILTIPKHLVQLLNWQDKSIIEFGFYKDKLTIKKIDSEQGIKKRGKAE